MGGERAGLGRFRAPGIRNSAAVVLDGWMCADSRSPGIRCFHPVRGVWALARSLPFRLCSELEFQGSCVLYSHFFVGNHLQQLCPEGGCGWLSPSMCEPGIAISYLLDVEKSRPRTTLAVGPLGDLSGDLGGDRFFRGRRRGREWEGNGEGMGGGRESEGPPGSMTNPRGGSLRNNKQKMQHGGCGGRTFPVRVGPASITYLYSITYFRQCECLRFLGLRSDTSTRTGTWAREREKKG